MAAREMNRAYGTIYQPSNDSAGEAFLDIKDIPTKAIQIYRFDGVFNKGTYADQQLTNQFLTLNVETTNNKVDFKPVFAIERSIVYAAGSTLIFPVTNEREFSWTAPPALILADKHIRIQLGSFSTGIANTLQWQMFYKVVSITDTQRLQLLFL